VPVNEVVNDVIRAFHHPALRDDRVEIQREMFATVRDWRDKHPKRHELETILESQSVKDGHNHIVTGGKKKKGGHDHGHGHSHGDVSGSIGGGGDDEEGGHGKVAGSLWPQADPKSRAPRGGDSGYGSGPSQPVPPPAHHHGYAPPPADRGYGGYQQPPHSQW